MACVWGADLVRLQPRGQGSGADGHGSLCPASTPLVLGIAPPFSFGEPHLPFSPPTELHRALGVGRGPKFGQRVISRHFPRSSRVRLALLAGIANMRVT